MEEWRLLLESTLIVFLSGLSSVGCLRDIHLLSIIYMH